MNIKNMKKRARKQKPPGINDPGRAQYVFESMEAGLCPDCRSSFDVAETIEDGAPFFEIECPSCGWRALTGGNLAGGNL